MMKKSLVLVSMASVAALLVAGLTGAFGSSGSPTVYASRLAGIQGAGGSGIQIQNLDASQEAQIVADFYNQKGDPAVTISRPNVAAGSAANIYMPTTTELKNGAYAAIISADRQIAAIARTDWGTSGGAAIYSNVIPGNEVSVPLAAKGYVGQTTLVSVQNTDTSQQATVSVELYVPGSTSALVTTSKNIGPGTSVTVDLGKDPAFATVPAGTLGSIVVKSAAIPVGVQAFMDIENVTKAVYAYEGVPSEQAAAKLYAPLIRNDFYGTSGISVVNPGNSQVDVSVTYIASPLTPACTGQSLHGGKSFPIAAKSSAVFYQGNVASLPTGSSGLPVKCLGAAVIESTGGNVLAIVNDADLGKTPNSPGNGTSAAYNAFSDAAGAKKVALPLYRKTHAGSLNLSTGIQAMNIGTAPANAVIEIKNDKGVVQNAGAEAQRTIAPLGSYTWFPPSNAGLAGNTYGSATLTSDQPLVVIVNDASGSGVVDAAIYSGIKAD